MTLVITNCSKRKRAPLDPTLHAGDLEAGPTESVAYDWSERLRAAKPVGAAGDLYAGRAFVEASRAAAALGGSLAIVSAGLGLVHATIAVPAYSLTTVHRDPDNILRKVDGVAPEWWAALQTRSPFGSAAIQSEQGLILAALSSSYLTMIADDWANWPAERLARLRLFTKERPRGVADGLTKAWMPYDDRLDAISGYAGTQGDFAQRAMRHFARTIGDQGALDQDRDAVRRSLEGLTARQVPARVRHTNEEIKALIGAHWETVAGRSGAMLRHLRDTLGVACEQGRFKGLFAEVAMERGGAQ